MSNKKFGIGMIVCVILTIIDQITKFEIVKNFELYESKEIIKDFFSLYYVRNTGSAFSFLADKDWGIYILSLISLVMAIVFIWLISKAADIKYKLIYVSLILLASGAIGNLIDRVRLHYVVDFLRFDFGSYTFPIFNFADICAVLGTLLLIYLLLFKGKLTDDYFSEVFPEKKTETKEDVTNGNN